MDRQRWLNFLLRRLLPAIAVAALLLASLNLAEEATGTAGLSRQFPWLLGASLLALVLLIGLIGQRLWRLRRELRRDAPGARMTRRLLFTLVLLAVPPVVVVYGFALRFLDATVDNWFNVPIENALDDSLEVGRIVVDQRLLNAEQAIAALATRIETTPEAETQDALDEAIDSLDAIELSVFAGDHRVIATASSIRNFSIHRFPMRRSCCALLAMGAMPPPNRLVMCSLCASSCASERVPANSVCCKAFFRCRNDCNRCCAISRTRASSSSNSSSCADR